MPIVNLANFQQFSAINLTTDPGHIKGKHPIPQCAEIKLVWIVEDGKNADIVLHGRYTGGFAGTVAQCNAIIAALTSGAGWTGVAAFLSTTATLAGVFIRDLGVIDQPYIQNTASGASGSSASPALPLESAVVITKRTAKVGPAARGRAYFPGWATNALGAGNLVAAAAVTALNSWANLVGPAFTAQGYTHCIALPPRAAYVGSSGASHDARDAGTIDVTTFSVRDNHWDSQRRRGLK